MEYDFNKKITIQFKTGITIPTCSRSSVEDLAKEMVRTFGVLPLMSVKESRHVIIEDFMSMFLKLNIEFEIGYGSIEVANNISDKIKEIMKNLPMVDVKFITTDVIGYDE